MMGSGIPKVLKRVEERGEVEFEKKGGRGGVRRGRRCFNACQEGVQDSDILYLSEMDIQ
jgi:hypothetical protein